MPVTLLILCCYNSVAIDVLMIHLHVVGKVVEGRLAKKLKYIFTPPTTGPAQRVELVLVAAALQ